MVRGVAPYTAFPESVSDSMSDYLVTIFRVLGAIQDEATYFYPLSYIYLDIDR